MTLKEVVDKKLDKLLPPSNTPPKLIHKAMRYSVFSGGKRIRPIIAMEASKVCGGRQKNALIVASAIELVHTYSLIHDDLPSMDDSDYRRGRLSCHKKFGEANAILAGDALLTLAFGVISKVSSPRIAIAAVEELSEAIGAKGMVGGQIIDLEFKNKRKDGDTLKYINRLKTARLFEASARIGAIAAGANTEKVRAMARYGAYLGEAFQIVDDIIDREDYAEIFGMDRARHDAGILIGKARAALSIFGNKAERLKKIADKVLERGKIVRQHK